MTKSVFEKVFDKVIIGVVAGTMVGINVNYIFPRMSSSIKNTIIAGSLIILTMIVMLYLKSILFRKKVSFQQPDILLKWVKENIQNEEVEDAVNKFRREMEQFFETFTGDTLFHIKSEWFIYKEDRTQLDEFVHHLHFYLLKKDFNDNEGARAKEILARIYNGFLEKIRRIKIREMNAENLYVDLNDKKLKRDIQDYEPYLGYWGKSDEWINNKMLKVINQMRKKHASIYFLDVGTGTGRLAKYLCQENDVVHLVDYDEKRLSEAQGKIKEIIKKEDHIKCIQSYFEKLENEDERNRVGLTKQYDIILCSHVIQHNSTEEVVSFYKIMYSLLASEGILFLLFPISKSKRDEFVVHGLEFDIVKIKKKDFLRSQRNKTVHNLNQYFRTVADFDTVDTQLSPNDDHSGYWTVTKEPNGKLLYEIAERKYLALAYKRVFDKGLIGSLDTHYAQYFSNENDCTLAIQGINECLENCTTYDERISEDALMMSNILSEYWLVSDIQYNSNVMIFDKGGCCSAKRVARVITKHRVYNDLLNAGQIPLKFLDFIPVDDVLDLKRNANTLVMEIQNSLGERIASIYTTENYYSLVLDDQEEYEVNIDTEELLMKKVPAILKEKFFKRRRHSADLIVDPQVFDGWLIKQNNEICYFARYDNDWIRIFRTEPVFKKLVEGKLSVEDHDHFPFELWNEDNIVIKPVIHNKMWKMVMEPGTKEKFTVLPNYTIIKIAKGNHETYCAYRDKKYYRLSRPTFDNLCRQQIKWLRILPTHRFVIGNLKKDLKREGLRVKVHTLYHSFEPKQSFLDKYGLRDQYLNLPIIKWFRRIHKKYDIQDCMFIIKKKHIKKKRGT